MLEVTIMDYNNTDSSEANTKKRNFLPNKLIAASYGIEVNGKKLGGVSAY